MAAPRGLPNRRDEVRDRLLNVVDELFAGGETYSSLTVERIMAAADLSRATFYVYFNGKSDLLRNWSRRVVEQTSQAARWWWELGPEATREQLRDVLARIVELYRPHAVALAAVHDAAMHDETTSDALTAVVEDHAASLSGYIARGQRGGWIARDLLPDETAAWLTWMGERGLQQMAGPSAGDADIDRLVGSYADVVWRTLYAFAPVRTGQA